MKKELKLAFPVATLLFCKARPAAVKAPSQHSGMNKK